MINCPGSWHDSFILSYGIYRKIEDVYNQFGGKVVVNSAFNASRNKKFLIKSAQNDPINATRYTIQLNRAATSVRQLSEWGMRMIQGQFPRLKDKMEFKEFGERKVILHLMVLLYNFQTEEVHINMITNSFMSKTKGFYSYNMSADQLSESANMV